MPGQRRYGMDHEHYDWSPISTRGILRWPNDSRVALCVIVSLDKMEWIPPEGSYQAGNLAGGSAVRPFPDYTRMSHREYGHRVGIFRVLDVLEKHGITPTVAMDALTAQNYPYLVQHCLDRGCEIIGHGISVSRMITSNMSEDDEKGYISQSIAALKQATGAAPRGWMGPEYGESYRTPQLLAEAGIKYVCDWANDEQPYPMKSPTGEITALPVMWELDDVGAMANRKVTVHRYCDLLKESFDRLYQDGAVNGRLLGLSLHPWLTGQPFRIGYLDDALGYMTGHSQVWPASGEAIIDWFRQNPPAAKD
ncbi:MAG: polysaccharide deacetylase family protein [Chloroflexi bacterium]|nr:polysaccharide deacetylase family protein [Chloroflexota bacterium]